MLQITKASLFVSIALTLLVACSHGPQEGTLEFHKIKNSDAIARGGLVYKDNCAACHGDNAQGADDWKQRDAQGLLKPPPLNGSGHAWHHPKIILVWVIKNGSIDKKNRMPSFKSKLSEQQISDVIAWFQSLWPAKTYQAWYTIDTGKR